MPKYGVHHIVLDSAVNSLKSEPEDFLNQTVDILEKNRFSAMLGAIGPDLFFWSPEYKDFDMLINIYQALSELAEKIDPFVNPVQTAAEFVGDEIGKTLDEIGLDDTRDMIDEAINAVNDTHQAIVNSITTGALSLALGGLNLMTDLGNLPSVSASFFDLFIPDRQMNIPMEKWKWFDVLHYRQTGEFASNLVSGANNDSLKAYAYGYLSHIATDLTGHPFVNQIVGGPYRLHPQRHTIVENFIDGRVYDEMMGNSSVNANLLDNLELEKELPNDIAELLSTSFQSTYTDPALRPREFLTEEQIKKSYENLYFVLTKMRDSAVRKPEEPFDGVAQIIENAFNDILEPFPAGPGNPSGTCSWEDIMSLGTTNSSRDCYSQFFNQLEDYLEHVAEVLEWLADTIVDIVDLLATLVLSGPISAILAGCYLIQLANYQLYCYIREPLIMAGFLYPEPENLKNSHLRSLTTTYLNCIPDRFDTYPKRRLPDVSPLVCPSENLYESYPVCPALYDTGSEDMTPSLFIKEDIFNKDIFKLYANAGSYQNTNSYHNQDKNVGNAIELTAYMIKTASNPNPEPTDEKAVFTDFDLDGDRGYFYKCWDGIFDYQPGVLENADIRYT